MQSGPKVSIVGGGAVGSLLAAFLVRRRFEVTVWERRPDPRVGSGAAAGSINLIVTSRGIRALREVGLDEAVARSTVPVTGRVIHALDGTLTRQPYGRDDSECNYSISRAGLNRLLIDEAERRGVRFRFGTTLSGMDLDAGRLIFEDGASGDPIVEQTPVVIGADGAASGVRAALALIGRVKVSVEPLTHGYKRLSVPAGDDGAFRMEKRGLHLWPRGQVLLMALPNQDGSFSMTLYMPLEGPSSFRELTDADRVRGLFERQFPDAIPLLPDLDGRFFASGEHALATVRCDPWHADGRAGLIGDAAHTIAPLFGQGMNCGFEDCTALDRLLAKHGREDWVRVFQDYTRERKPHADAIAEMSLENFAELRDRVGDARFLLRKEVEHRLELEWPEEYRSRYSMVMFGDVPYRVAQEAGRIQQEILDEVCASLERAEDLDAGRTRQLIRKRLTPFLARHGVDLGY